MFDASPLAEIKKALVKLDQGELLDTCLKLARFKKDNKELLTYLLFLAQDEIGYANYLCQQLSELFDEKANPQTKTIRKIVRWMNKCLRYSGNKETEAQVRIHFCRTLRGVRGFRYEERVIENIYHRELKKIHAAIEKLHPDLKADFRHSMAEL